MEALERVDVVIVSYNSESTLTRCIEAARAWDRVDQVIVVDNCSTDDSITAGRAVADHVVALETNRGFGSGQNVGVSRCRSDWVLILNPDAEVDAAGLEFGYCYATARDGVAMVEGTILRSTDGGVERWCGSEPGAIALLARLLRLRERLGERRLKAAARLAGRRDYAIREVDEPSEVQFLAAVAPLVRRRAFEQVGGFDEEIFLYAEDIDLCHRLRDAGWALVALPVDWARHIGAASSEGHERRRARQWWESHETLVRKHWTGPRRWLGLVVVAAARRWQGERGGS